MKFIITVSFIVSFCLVGSASADTRTRDSVRITRTTSADRLASLIESAYVDREIYVHSRCGDNVARLAKKMIEAGQDLSKAKVIYLLSEIRRIPPVPADRKVPLLPARARDNQETWDFHVVLALPQGSSYKIVDLDYIPKAVSASRYFAAMFPAINNGSIYDTGDRLNLISMRALDVSTYLEAYTEMKDGDAVARRYRDERLAFPVITSVREFLKRP